MKWIIVSALLTAMPHWISSALACSKHEGAKVTTKVVVVGDGDATSQGEGKTHIVKLVGDGEGQTGDCIWVSKDGEDAGAPRAIVIKRLDGEEGEDCVKIVRFVGAAAKGDEKRAWLGISMGKVTDAVDAQTGVQDRGVMILNVVGDSPADEAGLAKHDIILAIDGESFDGDIAKLAKLVGAHSADDKIEILILRGDQEQTVQAVLGSRAGLGQFEWKFNLPELAELQERIQVRGKFLSKGDDGNWVVTNLGDLDEIANLPKMIRMHLPKSGSRTISMLHDGDRKSVNMVIVKDGTTLTIEQEDGEEIVVTRIDEDGNETETTYAGIDELQEGDEEAFEAFNRTHNVAVIDLDIDGLPDLHDMDFDFAFKLDLDDLDDLHEHMGDWRVHIEEAMGEAGEQFESAMVQLELALEELKEGSGSALALPNFPMKAFVFRGEDDGSGKRTLRRMTAGKARQSFEVAADGQIEVLIRKGDSELRQIFEDEDDLAQRDPNLYAKYRELIDAQD
ncbi:MAG: PDZ domain-containing protein [Planctomycetes bacterium]|nr:PDZ domain-containing protein [Planctomycetota bacterium]